MGRLSAGLAEVAWQTGRAVRVGFQPEPGHVLDATDQAVAALAAVGLVAVGTLFSAMTVNTRLAELLLPMLALPFFVPVVTPAALATARLLAGRPLAEVAGLLRLLGSFDLVFLVACTLAFPFTLEE